MKHKTYYRRVRAVIRKYPFYCAVLEEMKSSKGDGVPARSVGAVSRPTERLALIELPNPAQRAEYAAVKKAIEHTKKQPTGAARLRVISAKYWEPIKADLHTAARLIHYSPQQTWRFHADFEQLVAFYLWGEE